MFEDLHIGEMLLRTTMTFAILLLFARVMGKEQVSQLTFFNYITGITIGSIAAEMAGQSETPFLNGLTSLIWWTALTIAISYWTMKSSRIKTIIDDQPTIVVKEGKILEHALKKSRLPLDDLSMLLRLQGVFSLKDVHMAILETNGQLSIYKKPAQQPPTKQDLHVKAKEPKYMPATIILEGKIQYPHLHDTGHDEQWLQQELKKQGIHSPEDVFYAEIQSNGSLYIDIGEDRLS